MTKLPWILFFLFWPACLLAETLEPCEGHDLRQSDCKEQLRRWSGMKPFARWRLLDLSLSACARDGRVPAEMLLAPPDAWSRLGLPVRIRVSVELDAGSGAPAGQAQQDAWRKLASDAKQVLTRAERNRVLRRFAYRYKVLQADLEPEDATNMRLTLLAGPGSAGGNVLRAPSLTWSAGAGGRVVAYRLLRMDGLPVRPELLRFVEVISEAYPRCRPFFIEGRRQEVEEPVVDPKDEKKTKLVKRVFWSLSAELEGVNCPMSMAARIEPNGLVSCVEQEEGLAGGASEAKTDLMTEME